MIGIDGEINSLVAAKLLKQALEENVVALVFDFGGVQTNDLVNFCRQLGLETYILQRGQAYQSEVSAYRLHKPSGLSSFYKRFINYHLLIQADHMKTVLVDTFDKSDRLLGMKPEGFYGHLMPFYSLYKSEICELAKFLGIPAVPTNYQGLPWDKIDPVLYLLTEKQLKIEDISKEHNIDLHWLRSLKIHVNKQLFQTTISQFII
ncbi:hypothetical protein HYW41_04545 [Candidatus Daviesbacteria bacterium]|nr:hypothetical protein [Candidatus Daviesbacteria bacterium]